MVHQEDIGRTINRAFATVPQAPLIDQAMHVFNAMLKQNQRELELARIFVRELAFVKGDHHGIDAVMEAFFSRMSVLIEQAQGRGEIRASVDPALLAYNLFALHFSFLSFGSVPACGRRIHPSPRCARCSNCNFSDYSNRRRK